MRGGTFRRCGCRDPLTGRKLGADCPQLASRRHGAWYFVTELPAGIDGKRRQLKRGGFATHAAAEAALDEVRRRLGTGFDVDDKETVGQWLESWFAAKRALRATTARNYRGHITTYLEPHLGDVPLERLRASHISSMYRAIEAGNVDRRQPVGPTTMRRIHATLRAALNAAVRQQRLTINPAVHVELRPPTRSRVRPWEPAELGQFLDYAAADRLGALYELIAMTGLRRGEAIGLTWDDVDVEQGHLTVRRQLLQLGHEVRVGQPKTKSGEDRVVELPINTIGVLLAHRLRQDADRVAWREGWQSAPSLLDEQLRPVVLEGLAFTREDGSPLHPEFVTRHFQMLAARAGLRRIRLHDLRHGAASLRLAAGVPIEIVSKILGHSSIALTADTYSHLLKGVARQAAEAASALVPRADAHARDHHVPTRANSGAEADPPEDVSAGQVGGPSGIRTRNPRIKSSSKYIRRHPPLSVSAGQRHLIYA
jgi:integrase